ncbi:MAG: hypothetical protein WCQ91_08285, partial [Planctomycetota bacterium]
MNDIPFTTGRTPSRLLLLSLLTLLAIALASPWIVSGALAVLGVDSTTPMEWVPATFPPREDYDQFVREFESGDVVVASWPGCTLGSQACARFIEAASGPNAPRNTAGSPWFESVASGSTLLER